MPEFNDDALKSMANAALGKSDDSSLKTEDKPSIDDTNVENKSEETKVEDKKVENNSEQPDIQQDNTPPNTEDFDTKYQQRFAKDIESYVPKDTLTEYETKLAELQKNLDEAKNRQPSFVSDYLQKLHELDKQGIQVTPENAGILTSDYSQVDLSDKDNALDIVKRSYKMEDFSAREVDRLVRKKFPALFDEDAEQDDIDDALIDLKIEAKQAVGKFQEVQSKIKTEGSQNRFYTIDQAKELILKQSQEESEKTSNAFRAKATEITKDLSTVSYDVGDGVKIEVDVTDVKDQIIANIESIRNNPNGFFDTDVNGNYTSFKDDVALQDAVDRVVAKKAVIAAYKQGLSNGSEKNMGEFKNAQDSNDTAKPQSDENNEWKSMAQAAAKARTI